MRSRPIAALTLGLLIATSAPQAEPYSLDAPGQAHIRQTLEVGWTAPQSTGGLLEIRAVDTGRRAAYAYVRENPQSIIAPEVPGEYRIVFLHDRKEHASRPLLVSLPEASVAVPSRVEAGAEFDVDWTGPLNRSDRITLAARDGEPIRGGSYAHVGNFTGGRALRLRAPMDPGDYDVVYLTGDTILARASLAVGSTQATLSHAPQVHAGGSLRIIWEGPRNRQDRILFAQRDGEPMRGGSYAHVANFDDHAVVLRAPERAGLIDVVYVSGDRVIGRSAVQVIEPHIALSAPDEVTALESFHAVWEGDGQHGDRIVVAGSEPPAYAHVRPDQPQTRLRAPAEHGDFHLVYVSREGQERARRPIRVKPAAVPPGTLVVEQGDALLGADDAVGVIFDASGSMLQRIDGTRRVDIARQTLADLVRDVVPAGTGFALRVFGHREAGSCRTDLEIPLRPLRPDEAVSTLRGIEARNLARTPLGRSIELAADDLADARGRRLLLVLTDGEETCDGNPAAAIETLRARGWDITVNIVGFAIDDPALEAEFAAWAALGNGRYYGATDRAQLASALSGALATHFTVTDADGTTVAEGLPGEALSLPAGEYTIAWGADRSIPATVPPGGSARVRIP